MSETARPATIEVAGLRSGYHGVTVLKGLDFTVGNEVFAVLGANGAGKTTLLATLARLLPLMAGTIRFRARTSPTLPPYETAGPGHRLRAPGAGRLPQPHRPREPAGRAA